MPIPLFFRVPPAASRRDPQTHVTKVRRSHDRQSPLLTPTRSALLYDPPLPSLLSPATSSRQILSATTTQFTTVTCYYDSLNGTNRHVPEFLRRDILIPRNDIADYFPSRLRDRGLASLTVTSVMSRQGAHAPRRRANQLPQATQQRVYSQPLRIYCLLFSLSYSYCTPYAFLLLGYDELVLIQNMLSLESLSLENLRFLIFVTVQQLSSDFLLSYALPFSTFLLVQLSKPVTKFYLSFCWQTSGVTQQLNFESRKLINRLNLDLVTVLNNLLIENLKLRCQEEKITSLNLIMVKLLASQRCKFNFIKFPAPRVDACTIQIEPKTEGMEATIKALNALHPITQLINRTPYLSTSPLCLFRTLRQKQETENECLIKTSFGPYKNDEYIISTDTEVEPHSSYLIFTAYKRVDKKIHPISMQLPPDCEVIRRIPKDPLLTLPPLTSRPPEFTPTAKITQERMKELNVNATGFLWPEEEKLFKHVMKLNENGIAFEDVERGTLKESYFSPYIIPTVPHSPWEYRNIPIPPGIMQKVLDVLKLKMEAGVYEQSQSSYRSRWFVVPKKNGKLRIVHDLQPLNKVTIRDAGMVPIIDDFVEGFAGRQCYTVFDLFWGFDARKIHPKSRGLTAFMTPLGLLQITSLPTGFTNSPAEFQKCMAMVLKDEIPHTANIFIDDLPIKGPVSQYLDENEKPEVLQENPGIRRFIWEHAQDVHRVLHRVHCAGATVSSKKAQICLPEALIVGQRCNAKGREPDTEKTSKILNWPPLTTPKEVRRFLGLCGTVRIWIPNYSKIVRPLTELYHKDKEFIWGKAQEETFATIKKYITEAPALHPINYKSDNPVILSVDSSRDAAGMILSQIDDNGRKRPARYGSIPMSERESRYSQPKLELFGLYRALRHWRLYIIGVRNLQVEVDAKYIKGMLNEPDLQPNAAINRWIQGILMFDFALVHVPANRHKGPDALSRRPLAEGEIAEPDDDSWLDNIVLLTYFPG